MPRRPALPLCLVAVLAAPAAGAGAPSAYRAPRTVFGAFDLEGVWTNQTATHLERPAGFTGPVATPEEMRARAQRQAAAKARKDAPKAAGDGGEDGDVGQGESEFGDDNTRLIVIDGGQRTSVISDPADGRLPYTAEGRRLAERLGSPKAHGLDNPEDRSASERCIAEGPQAGPPFLSGPDNANLQIVQTRGEVGLLSELIHQLRLVRLGAAHAPLPAPAIGGDAVGRWEGDTLVVETLGQSPLVEAREVDGSVLLVTPRARVVERFRRTSPTEIRYAFTVTDPAVYARPWSGEMVLRKVDKPIFEFACHEGNYALANILQGAREKEKRAAASSAGVR